MWFLLMNCNTQQKSSNCSLVFIFVSNNLYAERQYAIIIFYTVKEKIHICVFIQFWENM